MLNKDKSPCNKQRQEHGHWLLHWHNGEVMFDLHYINGVELGIFTEYNHNGTITTQTYHAR
jgi:antitoxin component YwqK of YwqJK toxin-antitoxin module